MHPQFHLISRLDTITKKEAPPADSYSDFCPESLFNDSDKFELLLLLYFASVLMMISQYRQKKRRKRNCLEREERNLISPVTSDSYKGSVAISPPFFTRGTLRNIPPFLQSETGWDWMREKRRSRRPFCSFSDPVA